jgi:hypothetical protein
MIATLVSLSTYVCSFHNKVPYLGVVMFRKYMIWKVSRRPSHRRPPETPKFQIRTLPTVSVYLHHYMSSPMHWVAVSLCKVSQLVYSRSPVILYLSFCFYNSFCSSGIPPLFWAPLSLSAWPRTLSATITCLAQHLSAQNLLSRCSFARIEKIQCIKGFSFITACSHSIHIWPLDLNHMAMLLLVMAHGYSRYAYDMFYPHPFVLTHFIQSQQSFLCFLLFDNNPHQISTIQPHCHYRWCMGVWGMYIKYYIHFVSC